MNNRMLYALLFAYGSLFTSAIVTGHRIFLVAIVALTVGAVGGLGLHSAILRRKERGNH